MIIPSAGLPTPLAQVVRRLNIIGDEDSSDTFMHTSYVVETAIKLIGIVLYSGLKEKSKDHAYRIGYELIRADGLGVWGKVISDVTAQPFVGFLPPEMNGLVTWITKNRTKAEDEWFRKAKQSIEKIFELFDIDSDIPTSKPTIKHLVNALVQIRNKTKAHGAFGSEFYVEANRYYIDATRLIIDECPIFGWKWMHLVVRDRGNNRGIILEGDSPYHARDKNVADLSIVTPGIHFWPNSTYLGYPIPCSDLLLSDRDCNDFFVPNGGHQSNQVEFINYGNGKTSKQSISMFSQPPIPLPPSETHGLAELDVQSNVWGNLPKIPNGYVIRQQLEAELELRLRDQNHPIITLHGRGGIGKTSLALKVIHSLANEPDPFFEYMVWFSARDIDLRPNGPINVRPSVVNLEMISKMYGVLFQSSGTIESFADILRSSSKHTNKGILFVFDNFETMTHVHELHQFLDTYTHIPNKVLITSRERSYKADFPIEVHGMEYKEAQEMLIKLSQDLKIEGIVNDSIIEKIYEYSEGHPYIMRILIGETAKEGRYIPPKNLIPRRMDIVNAVFERSFNKLSENGKRVFLIVSNWKSAISELALIVILTQRSIDVESGIEECVRVSLISEIDYSDEHPAYIAPQIARIFGGKKLEGDPDRLLIQEDLSILHRFGVMPVSKSVQLLPDPSIKQFIDWCKLQANEGRKQHLDSILETLASLWPQGWIELALFRQQFNFGRDEIEYALRRAVEERPSDARSWRLRAEYAVSVKDYATFVSSRIRAAELEPTNVVLVGDVAQDVCRYVIDNKVEIPINRRSIYLASIREQMVKLVGKLDATGLSRLAWLFYLEEDRREAWKYASIGLKKDGSNEYCRNLIDTLRREGFMP